MAQAIEEQIVKFEKLIADCDKKIENIAKMKKILQKITAALFLVVGLVGAGLHFTRGSVLAGIGMLVLGIVLCFLFYVASGFVLGFLFVKNDANARSEKAIYEGQLKVLKKKNK